ncbi:hypothetical protein UPYG_G00186090 [Umbra pygmaea]|uniref:Ribonuclease P/MRP protein subunit POP5 n=1 Tax=Umbra pygmaea TaxID=75934 RepID=A0ABD0XGW0_UMBPY
MVRLKSRYLLCEVCVSDRSHLLLLDDGTVQNAAKHALIQAHGDYGFAHSIFGFSVKYLNAHTGIVLLRCRKSHYRLIWSALPFITGLKKRGQKVPCFFNCLHVGGTIRTCQKFLVRYNTQQLHRMLPLCHSEEERSAIRKSVLSCTVQKDADADSEEDIGEED